MGPVWLGLPCLQCGGGSFWVDHPSTLPRTTYLAGCPRRASSCGPYSQTPRLHEAQKHGECRRLGSSSRRTLIEEDKAAVSEHHGGHIFTVRTATCLKASLLRLRDMARVWHSQLAFRPCLLPGWHTCMDDVHHALTNAQFCSDICAFLFIHASLFVEHSAHV